MRTRKPNPSARSWITSSWCRPAVLTLLPLSLAFSLPQIPPTCYGDRPDLAAVAPCHLVPSGSNGIPLTLGVRDHVNGGTSGSVAERFPAHETSGLTLLGTHVDARDNCGHCYDMDDHHFAYSIGQRKDYGPGHEQGAPTGWHMHRALPGNCGVDQHATPCESSLAANETIEEVIDALGAGDIDTLAILVSDPRVQVVRARSAIQVIGCDGRTLVANVPMDLDILSALAEFVAEQ